MYVPPYYQMTDAEEIRAFICRYNFATVISQHEGRPVATHLPFALRETASGWSLISHFAKANPQTQSFENQPVLIVFSEPHAYISPSHYDSPMNVPTWNYLAVHVYGQARFLLDPAEALAVLETSIDSFEPAYRAQWETLPSDYKMRLLRGIVAFEVQVQEIQAKKKLSQNKTEAEQARIAAALGESPHTKALAEWMNKR